MSNDPSSEQPEYDLPTVDSIDDLPEPEEEAGQMSFLDHLEELRWTLFKSFISFGLACILIGVFIAQFSDILRWPFDFAVSGREIEMSGLINTSILGVFSVIFYLLLGGGLALSLPFILYFVGSFVAPGLNERELRLLRPACTAAFVLFLAGAAFSFFVLVPAAMRASIIFNEMLGFAPLWTASSYYGLLTWMVLGVGIAFQFPLVLLILVYLEIISRAQLVGFRRYSIVIFLCIGALVTPTTDPVTFILLAFPMSLLYELAIFGAKRIEGRIRQEEED
ncbi:MAG: twin-arginine translocase subunit TatC [Puniceicoccaceae bacterium]